MNTAGN